MQLRDAGELSLDDVLTQASARERACADDRPDARARVRTPARAARRDLGDHEGAEPRRASRRHRRRRAGAETRFPGGTTRTSPSRSSVRSSRGRTASMLGAGAPGPDPRPARTLADDARPGRSSRSAVTSSSRNRTRFRLERDLDLGPSARSGSSGRRPETSRAGAHSSSAGDDRVLTPATPRLEVPHVRSMVDHEGLGAGMGHGPRALPLPASISSSATAAHAGPSRGSRRQPEDEDRRGGADEHRCRCSAPE